MSHFKFSAVFLASLFAVAQVSAQAQPVNPGASAATNAAIGGVSQGVVFAAVVGVAMVAAVNSGSSGAVMANPATVAAEQGSAFANTAVIQAAIANTAASNAIKSLAKAGITGVAFDNAVKAANDASAALTQAIANSTAAASNLSAASKVAVVGVVNNGVTICAAPNSCTKAELLFLQLRATELAKEVAVLTQDLVVKTQNLAALVKKDLPSFDFEVVNAELDIAKANFLLVQTAANKAIETYNIAAAAAGSGTALAPSTGTIPASGTTGTV